MKVASYLVLFASLVAVGTYGSRQVSAQSSKPRIFFIEPKNGASVKSPVQLKFGIENYKIAAVPDGTVTTARPGHRPLSSWRRSELPEAGSDDCEGHALMGSFRQGRLGDRHAVDPGKAQAVPAIGR